MNLFLFSYLTDTTGQFVLLPEVKFSRGIHAVRLSSYAEAGPRVLSLSAFAQIPPQNPAALLVAAAGPPLPSPR